MSRNVYFYNIAIQKDNKKTDLSLLPLIDRIFLTDEWQYRVRKIDTKKIALFPRLQPIDQPHIRIMPFGFFRTTYKPFLGKLTTSAIKEIEESVVEFAVAVYNDRYRSVAILPNLFLRESPIQDYLSSFLEQSFGSKWVVSFFDIFIEDVKEEIQRSDQIRALEITLRLSKHQEAFILPGVQQNFPLISLLLNSLNETRESFDAQKVTLRLSVGSSKNATMNMGAAKGLLNALNLESDSIAKVKVIYRNYEEDIKDADLKKIGQKFQTVILKDDPKKNPAPDYIGDKIAEIYPSHQRELAIRVGNFLADAIPGTIFPEFRKVPSPEHFANPENDNSKLTTHYPKGLVVLRPLYKIGILAIYETPTKILLKEVQKNGN